METKGKAVDSVIQYQLHKESNGGGDFKCNYQNVLFAQISYETHIITNDDYNNDIVIKAAVDDEVVSIGDSIYIANTNITADDIMNRGILLEENSVYSYNKIGTNYFDDGPLFYAPTEGVIVTRIIPVPFDTSSYESIVSLVFEMQNGYHADSFNTPFKIYYIRKE